MSRLGKQPITIPKGVEVKFAEGVLTVKGPKGELKREFKPSIKIEVGDTEITTTPVSKDIFTNALWGTYSSHIMNMIIGVTTGYEKKLILDGVGFKVDVKGSNLEMALGFSHPVVKVIPDELTVTAEKNTVTVQGIDKDLVGQFSAETRALKKPEPYKGKGFHYQGEVIRRKQGKKSA
ncbi:MAG: 50S ribosomal protein L6 [Candidatus Nomurabacteria bacterium]|nr:50S ribosomal protein L6 [Candidatus Nomurabacteria bacterium]